MISETVRREARNQFNCSSLEGADFEDEGGAGTANAHWSVALGKEYVARAGVYVDILQYAYEMHATTTFLDVECLQLAYNKVYMSLI